MMKGSYDINQIITILSNNQTIKDSIPPCMFNNIYKPASNFSNHVPNHVPNTCPHHNSPFNDSPFNDPPHIFNNDFVCKPVYKKYHINPIYSKQSECKISDDLSDMDSLDELDINISI